MLKSFFIVLGSLFFAIFFLFFLQLDWRGKTLEVHFTSWIKGTQITLVLREKSKILQLKMDRKFFEIKKEWISATKNQSATVKKEIENFVEPKNFEGLEKENFISSKKPVLQKNPNRLNKITKAIQEKFKRSLSNTQK